MELCDELLEDYAAMGGFVIPTVDDDGEKVTSLALNEEAKAAWEALHPEPAPQPNAEEDAEAMMVDLAYRGHGGQTGYLFCRGQADTK